MNTHYASADRLGDNELRKEMEFVGKNPIIDGLLHSVSGLLAVLNSHRQILVVNDLLMKMLNLENTEMVFGFRLGEALKCIHSSEMPGGCGTSEYCSTCGAAISMVTSLATNTPTERKCALVAEEDGKKRDLFFRVRCVPVVYQQKPLLLLFMQDISYQQKLEVLKKTFFHDINGIIGGLLNGSFLLSMKSKEDIRDISQIISKLSLRLASEISIQQCLEKADVTVYQPVYSSISLTQLFQDIKDIFTNHPASLNRSLVFSTEGLDVSFHTEPSLLIRVLTNMITNALEETAKGDEVRVWHETSQERITIFVWNRKPIPVEIAKRIFQRNFSTKAETGRGIGTYSMKLFGENILGGIVDFTTSEEEGTVFRISLKKET